MPTPLTDADKVLRNDTGKDIVEKLDDIAQALGVGVNADQINYDNTTSGLESTDVQDAIDEVNTIQNESIEKIYNYIRFPYISNIDKVPYLFRKSGGSISVGDWEEDKLVGGSVSFNQLIQDGNFPTGTESSWSMTNCTIAFTDNKCTITTSTTSRSNNIRQVVMASRQNHVIFVTNTVTCSKSTGITFYIGGTVPSVTTVQANTRTVVSNIVRAMNDYTNNALYFYFNYNQTLSVGDTVTYENAFAVDLTQMFGSTIADYILSLETANEGAGVEFFCNLFPNVYYAYNTGEIVSVKTSAHKVTGKNLFNKALPLDTGNITDDGSIGTAGGYYHTRDYYPVLPNTEYTTSGDIATGNTRNAIACYDANKNFIIRLMPEARGGWTFTTPASIAFIRMNLAGGSMDVNTIQLEQGNTATTYEPYEEHIYPLDSNLELRGSIKLDTTTNTLYNDGDTYDSDGNVVRKYGYIDLGNLSWSAGGIGFYANVSTAISPITTGDENASCAGYTRYDAASTTAGMLDKTFDLSDGNLTTVKRLMIRDDSYNGDAAAFTTGVTGKYLVYTLATPTTETAAPFTNPQRVFNNGTEEYIDNRTIAIPVGHETKYQYNI